MAEGSHGKGAGKGFFRGKGSSRREDVTSAARFALCDREPEAQSLSEKPTGGLFWKSLACKHRVSGRVPRPSRLCLTQQAFCYLQQSKSKCTQLVWYLEGYH